MLSPWDGDDLEKPGPGRGEKDGKRGSHTPTPRSTAHLHWFPTHNRVLGGHLSYQAGKIRDDVWTAFGAWKGLKRACIVNRMGVGRKGHLATLPDPPSHL